MMSKVVRTRNVFHSPLFQPAEASEGVQERGPVTKKHKQKDEEGRQRHRILVQLKGANKTPVAVHS
jgi:hypothetical protein